MASSEVGSSTPLAQATPAPPLFSESTKLVAVAVVLLLTVTAGIYAGISSPLLGKVLALSLTSAALVGFYNLAEKKPPSTILAHALKSCLVFCLVFGAVDLASHGPTAFGLPSDLPYNDLCHWGGSGLLAATGALLAKKFLASPPPLLTAEEQAAIDSAELVSKEELAAIGDSQMHCKTIFWKMNGYVISGQLKIADNSDPTFLPYIAAYIEKVVLPDISEPTFENITEAIEHELQQAAEGTSEITFSGYFLNPEGQTVISIHTFPQEDI